MNSYLSRRFPVSVLLLAALGSYCAVAAAQETVAPAEPPAAEIPPEAQYHIMAGELAAGRKQPGIAAQAFLLALDKVPDRQLAARTTALALAARDEQLAGRAAQRWLEIEPSSMDAREVITALALRNGDMAAVKAQCIEIIKGHPGGEADGFRHVALLLSQTPEPAQADAALGLLQELAGEWPKLAGAQYALGLSALRYERLPLAEQAARAALRLQPDSQDYGLLLTGVLVRKQDFAGADAAMEQLLKKSKDKDDVRLAYTKLLLEGGAREQARAQLRKIVKDSPKNKDARYALGVLALNDGSLDDAEALFQPLAKDVDRGKDAEFQLGRIAEQRGNYEQALKHYEKVSSGNQAIDAAVRRAAVFARLKRYDEARDLLGQLRSQFPPLAERLYLAEGELLLNAGATDLALATYAEALQRDPENAEMLYGRSLVHERLGKLDLAEADLRAILAQDGDDSRALNALGYMLAVHSDRLDEARKLIERALEQQPDDPAVIDSLGWVQYKQGQIADARVLLQKAYDKIADPEIAAHLGEVLWVQGDRDQARAVWDKALAKDPDHRALNDTVKRLTQ